MHKSWTIIYHDQVNHQLETKNNCLKYNHLSFHRSKSPIDVYDNDLYNNHTRNASWCKQK